MLPRYIRALHSSQTNDRKCNFHKSHQCLRNPHYDESKSTSENAATKHSNSSRRRVWRLLNVFLTMQPLRRCPFLASNWKKYINYHLYPVKISRGFGRRTAVWWSERLLVRYPDLLQAADPWCWAKSRVRNFSRCCVLRRVFVVCRERMKQEMMSLSALNEINELQLVCSTFKWSSWFEKGHIIYFFTLFRLIL